MQEMGPREGSAEPPMVGLKVDLHLIVISILPEDKGRAHMALGGSADPPRCFEAKFSPPTPCMLAMWLQSKTSIQVGSKGGLSKGGERGSTRIADVAFSSPLLYLHYK